MEVIIGGIIALVLIWVSIKAVKLAIRIFLWLLAILTVIGVVAYYVYVPMAVPKAHTPATKTTTKAGNAGNH